MGQTLPHGVYLPDNGERNCYTGLSQNWQKLDNLLGNQGSNVSFTQTLTEGVEIGKITINGEEVSLYHTDYSGKANASDVYTKAEADTLLNEKAKATDLTAHTSDTNIHVTSADKNKWNGKQDALSAQQLSNIADVTKKANDSDVVHKSGNETINGMKIFSGSLKVSKTSPDIALDISDCDVTEIPTEAKSATLYFRDKNYKNLSYIVSQHRANGQNRMCYRTHRTDNINNYYSVDLDSDGNFYPEQNNAINLGVPALKWKSFNGINPGALSLPNHNSYLDIKSNLPASVSDDLWTTRYQITPTQDGILILQLNNCSGIVVWSNLNLPSYGDRGNSICTEKRVMAFVLKDVTYNIVTSNYSQVTVAKLFYCQGNV